MPNALPYYPRYPRDLIEGTVGMSMELKLSYGFLIDLIYWKNGRLPDDPRFISGMFNCSVRKWNNIRKELLNRDKIIVENGYITNYRAIIELEKLSKYRNKQAENRRGSNKNNNLEEPPLNQSKPEPKPYKSSSMNDDVDDDVYFNFCDAIVSGVFPNIKIRNPEVRRDWLNLGLDPQKQIYPALKEICKNAKVAPLSWKYFNDHMIGLAGGKADGSIDTGVLSNQIIISNVQKILGEGLEPPKSMMDQYNEIIQQGVG